MLRFYDNNGRELATTKLHKHANNGVTVGKRCKSNGSPPSNLWTPCLAE